MFGKKAKEQLSLLFVRNFLIFFNIDDHLWKIYITGLQKKVFDNIFFASIEKEIKTFEITTFFYCPFKYVIKLF